MKQLLKNKRNLAYLIGLYLITLYWLWVFPQLARFWAEMACCDYTILAVEPFYLVAVLFTMGNTLLAYHFAKNVEKNSQSKLWVSNILIFIQSITMIFILSVDFFLMCNCVE